MSEKPDQATPSWRASLRMPLIVGAATFVIFMFVELVIYGKGIGRALIISAIAGVALFLGAFVIARADTGRRRTGSEPRDGRPDSEER